MVWRKSVKKVLIIIGVFLFTVNLSASDSADLDESYEAAMKSYKSKDFKATYKILSKLYLQNLSDANLNFYLGRAAYETGHYEVALAAFERVEILDSGNLRNRLEMARTYFMLKMYEDSQNAFKYVLENPNIPNSVRTNIELSLSRVLKVQQKSFTYARVMADILYDSNINYGSLDDYQYGGGTLGKVDAVSDTALQVYANITNIYDTGDKGGIGVKNSLSFYLKDYMSENDYNVGYLSYAPSLLYKDINYMAEFVLGVDIMTLGGEKYLYTMSLMPRVQYKHTPTLSSILFFKYQDKNFFEDAQEDLDASRYEISYGLQDILTPRSYLQGNIALINETKVRGANLNVDFNEFKVDVNYANQFTSKYGFDFYAQLRLRKYSDYSSGFGSTREEVGGRSNAGFTMNIIPTLQATLRASYEYVNSNQDRYTFHKYTATAGIVKTF